MSDKKKQQFSQKRLRELEKQVEEYTEEDYLNEADELEKEMLAGNITYDLPDDFLQQILAKGKLIEAEKERNKQKTAGQEVKNEAESKSKRVWDASALQDAEPVNITAATSEPSAEPPAESVNVAGRPEDKPELLLMPQVLAAVEITTEQEMVRADISDANEVKTKVPAAAVQRNEAAVEENGEQNSGQGNKKPRRGVKLRWKVLLTVVILVMVPLAAGITSGGKKHFVFEAKEDNNGDSHRISLSNDGFAEDIADKEMSAYDEIEKQIGIDALKMGDRPTGVRFDSYVVSASRADITFYSDNDNFVVLTEINSPHKSKIDYTCDAQEERTTSVYNNWLEMEINIYKEIIETGEIKYHSEIVIDNALYTITAIIDLKDFEVIIKGLYF